MSKNKTKKGKTNWEEDLIEFDWDLIEFDWDLIEFDWDLIEFDWDLIEFDEGGAVDNKKRRRTEKNTPIGEKYHN